MKLFSSALVLSLALSVFSAQGAVASVPAFLTANVSKTASKNIETYPNGLAVIDRFLEVENGFYRGAFPASFEQMKTLKAYKINTIITLSNNEEMTEIEKAHAKKLGIRLIAVPLHGWNAPTDKQTEEVQALFNNPKLRPIFVHCKHGRERTGLEIAIYRQRTNGWTGEAAYAEAKKVGFRPIAWNLRIYLKRALGLID